MNRLELFCNCVILIVHVVLTTQSVINSYKGCPAYLQRKSNVFSYTDTCLELVDKEHSWKGARKHCKKYGGDLVVIHDIIKQQFIMNALRSLGWDRQGVWIGGTHVDGKGVWKWVTGERMTWGYWRHGHGRSHTGFLFHKRMFQDCAQIRTDDRYRWYGFPCRGRIGFHYSSICEYYKIFNKEISYAVKNQDKLLIKFAAKPSSIQAKVILAKESTSTLTVNNRNNPSSRSTTVKIKEA